MFLDLKQKPVLTQKLIMTPQLQQGIKLLQLSRVEFMETVRQELAENPGIGDILDRLISDNL